MLVSFPQDTKEHGGIPKTAKSIDDKEGEPESMGRLKESTEQ
jgi:hypothetical protein